MTTYITDCPGGFCRVSEEEKIKVPIKIKSGRYSLRDACPAHGGIVIQRSGVCSECGKEFYAGRFGNMPERCQACTKRRHRKIMREYKTLEYVKMSRKNAASGKPMRAIPAGGCLNLLTFCGKCIMPQFKCSMKGKEFAI